MRISKPCTLLALSFLLLNTSCKKIAKEFIELFSKESVEQLSKEIAEEGVEVSAKSLGRASVKILPYDEFLESLAKENKSLVRSLRNLDDGLQKSIAKAMQTDEAFARMMQSSKTLGDEFISFTKEAAHLKKDFSVFRLFLASKNAVQGSPWHRLGIRSNGVGTELLQGNKVLGELRDGVLTLRETIIPNKGFAPNSLLSDELLPNTLFKIPAKAGDARSLIIKTDALGRMEMSNLSNASFDELVNTSLMRQNESFLSLQSLDKLRQSLGNKLYSYRIKYNYLTDGQKPSFIKLEVLEQGKTILRETLEGINDKVVSPLMKLLKASYFDIGGKRVLSVDLAQIKGFNEQGVLQLRHQLLNYLNKLSPEEYAKVNKDMPSHLTRLIEDFRLRLPSSNGLWSGSKGNSMFVHNADYIPSNGKGQYRNLQGKTMGQIYKENGIKGIVFRNGYPDFSPVAKARVVLPDGGTFERYTKKEMKGVHDQAFEALAKQWGKTVEEVMKYKELNNLVWHEVEDGRTLQLVVREVHDNTPHIGGISMYEQAKKYLEAINKLLSKD